MLASRWRIDELAYKLRMDPVSCASQRQPDDPERGPSRPYSEPQADRMLARRRAALRLGEARAGAGAGTRWPLAGRHGRGQRHPQHFSAPAVECEAEPRRQGRLLIETSMTDIGTGTYTVLAQIAAETTWASRSIRSTVRLGDSNFSRGRRVDPPRSAHRSAGASGSFDGSAQAAVPSALLALRRLRRAWSARFERGRTRPRGASRHALGELRRYAGPQRARQRGARQTCTLRSCASRVRRALLRGGGGHRHRRDARAPHARRVRRGPHPQRENSAETRPSAAWYSAWARR